MGRSGAIAVSGLLGLACYSGPGGGGDGDDADTGQGTAAEAGSAGDASDTGDDPALACALPPRRLALLSNRRYGHAVRDLLGLASAPTPSNGGGTHDGLVPAGPDQVSASLVFEYHDIAEAAAAEALLDLDALAPCADGQDERVCAGAFVDDLGGRAFRRPLTTDEHDGLLAVWQVGRDQDGDYAGGVRLVVVTVLQAPSFLYASELGVPGVDGTFELSPWEVATQLSFLLLDSIPDAALREAAADGRLSSDEGVAAEVERLLATGAGQANVSDLVLRWIGSDRVGRVEKQAPEFTDELRESMRLETQHFVDDLLWNGDASLDALLTSPDSFVDGRLAAIYDIPAPEGDGFVPVSLPADRRAGILTHPSMLAGLAGVADTSVVFRGLFVARDLLCMEFPPPPPEAAEAGLDESVGQRARAEHRMATAPCSNCHRSFDPFGLLFENYDELGRYRATIGDTPVDASAQIERPETLAGPVATLVEFAPQLAAAPEVAACATQRFTTYAVQRAIDADLQCHVDDLAVAFVDGGKDLVDLVRLVATARVLRARSEAEAP